MQTAPSGVRRLTRAGLAAGKLVHNLEQSRGHSRKEVSSAARDACQALELRPSMRQVLQELVGSYGEQEIERGLMVWPSNRYLERKTGLAERTIRKCVAGLVELKLLAPVDSANRKRFAIKRGDGSVLDAYGFDLSPLIVRRAEFAGLLLQQRLADERVRRLFDDITIARKAIEETLRQLEDTVELETELTDLVLQTPRRGRADANVLEILAGAFRDLRDRAEKLFLDSTLQEEDSANPGSSCRHIESNNGSPSGSCQSGLQNDEGRAANEPDLSLVMSACPTALEHYDRPVRDVPDLVMAGRYLRPTIGAHASAWTEAVDEVGAVVAAIAVFYVLQLHDDDVSSGRNRIRSPGGLFRSIVRRIKAGDFDVRAELHALRRKRLE